MCSIFDFRKGSLVFVSTKKQYNNQLRKKLYFITNDLFNFLFEGKSIKYIKLDVNSNKLFEQATYNTDIFSNELFKFEPLQGLFQSIFLNEKEILGLFTDKIIAFYGDNGVSFLIEIFILNKNISKLRYNKKVWILFDKETIDILK